MGGIASFIGTAEVLGVLGLGRLALNLTKKAEVVSHLAPRFLPAAITSGSVFGTHSGISEVANQVHEGKMNVFKLGAKSMSGFLEGAALGAVGKTMGYFKRIVMAGGVGYVSGYSAAKSDGLSDEEANKQGLLVGATFGGFEAIGSSGRDMELKKVRLRISEIKPRNTQKRN